MRRESKTKMVEVTEVTYIAYDGKEFTNEEDCEAYENSERKDFIEQSEKLRIKELDCLMPLILKETMEYHDYRWYKLQGEDDYKILSKVYSNNYFNKPSAYPTVMCVETWDYYDDEYDGDAYNFTLNECKEDTIKFWQWQGYKVTIEKK